MCGVAPMESSRPQLQIQLSISTHTRKRKDMTTLIRKRPQKKKKKFFDQYQLGHDDTIHQTQSLREKLAESEWEIKKPGASGAVAALLSRFSPYGQKEDSSFWPYLLSLSLTLCLPPLIIR
jgi:hypothetical protein